MTARVDFFWLALSFLAFIGFTKVVVDRFDIMRGVLFSSYIEFKTTEGEIMQSKSRSGYKYVREYDIVYVYSVNGTLYDSRVVDFLGDYTEVSRYLSKYKKGDKVSVYYDQNNPRFSVLDPNKKSYSVFILPFIMLLLSVISTLYALFYSKRAL